ncbi:hypothetical protein SMACR_03097 [Sordaria macrospora]|uniref:WGS project CABT00000000 data, contig 2.7 n=2 Tax=Sordaria macrospora TaxID=5147 RepID=F7VU86_SORMK|nr:uncharacterized protein SMAC_03097 [Sordaria macrospora k-hell]KAA8628068.1 hypothetical protein SMACR_03097 [Sordaria macrospora]KAH7632872.1 hypothetical protein B0T09DRAFT_406446 [Sordaria sp. MPI-SDFR-AT-0083]WPJ60665.1 hypothetical protein SMAC4_03097 [Sordaria macrospora]CCC09074.1 unnamed protein product [Sordaria macrospora k-hell]
MRLGPLTSQALGRSPYDEVVEGTGEPQPGAPEQLYDDRGRPVNPETRRINRDIIRSHNEVMLVIGVAEPDSGINEAQALYEAATKHQYYEDGIGRRLFLTGEVLATVGVWGVNGLRQRILLYKDYAHVPFSRLFGFHRSQQSWGEYIWAGLPSSVLSDSFAGFDMPEYPWVKYVFAWVNLHLEIFVFMQRTGLVNTSRWVPTLGFFVPGCNDSPIFLPKLPSSFTNGSIISWLGALVAGVVPFAGYWFFSKTYARLVWSLRRKIQRRLPKPINFSRRRTLKEVVPYLQPPSGTYIPPTPTPEEQQAQQQQRQETQPRTPTPTQQQQRQAPNANAIDAGWEMVHAPSDAIPTNDALPTGPPPDGTLRRQSTISVSGAAGLTTPGGPSSSSSSQTQTQAQPSPAATADEAPFLSDDDEETEHVNPTLITFDVDTSDSATSDSAPIPPGAAVWAAELRPNVPDNSSSNRNSQQTAATSSTLGLDAPLYRDNGLTRLPHVLAAGALGLCAARAMMTPFESLALLGLARPYVTRQMGFEGAALDVVFHGLGFLDAFSLERMFNAVGLEMVHLVLQCDLWAGMMCVADWFRMSDEEWCEAEGVKRRSQE